VLVYPLFTYVCCVWSMESRGCASLVAKNVKCLLQIKIYEQFLHKIQSNLDIRKICDKRKIQDIRKMYNIRKMCDIRKMYDIRKMCDIRKINLSLSFLSFNIQSNLNIRYISCCLPIYSRIIIKIII